MDCANFLEPLRGKTILLTGAAGYVGTAMLHALKNVPCRIVAVSRSRLRVPCECCAQLEEIQADLSQQDAWTDVLHIGPIDIVFHLAAHEHRRGSIHAPHIDLAVNAGSVLSLLECCRAMETTPRIVFASSANIVGMVDRVPVNEATHDSPVSLFSIHKLTAERYLRHYAQEYGISAVALRFANLYGPIATGSDELVSRAVVNRMILHAFKGHILSLYNNQHCIRDFLFVDDAVTALFAAATSMAPMNGDYYIVGSEMAVTFAQIAAIIVEKVETATGNRPTVRYDPNVALSRMEMRDFVADCQRIRCATGWTPVVGIHDGIGRTLARIIEDSIS